jgi:hypothetical protein
MYDLGSAEAALEDFVHMKIVLSIMSLYVIDGASCFWSPVIFCRLFCLADLLLLAYLNST